MSVRDLIPWGRNNNPVPASYREDEQSPFLTLHREMNRLFDDVWRGFNAPLSSGARTFGWNSGWPEIEVSETEKSVRVTAEVPGLDEKDVEVLFEDGVLTLRGEKRSELEDKDRQFSERFYGRFERRIPLGAEVEDDKASASFKNGVLTIELPKNANAQSKARRIQINGDSRMH